MFSKFHRTSANNAGLTASFSRLNGNVFVGFVLDPSDLSHRFTVELIIDGIVIDTTYAENYTDEIAEQGLGDGCYGFSFRVNSAVIDGAKLAEARIANLGYAIGSTLDLRDDGPEPAPTSRLRWLGGLRFSGWVSGSGQTPSLNASVDGELVAQVTALGWAQSDDPKSLDEPMRSFDIHLPERFADGCVRWLSVHKDTGESIHGSPIPFVAFPDGLAAVIDSLGTLDSERLRGEMYDRLIPMSFPMSDYDQWRQRFPAPQEKTETHACAVVMVGDGSVDASLASLDRQTISAWTACHLAQEGGHARFDPGDLRSFLDGEAGECEFIVFALTGTVFSSEALQRLAEAFSQFEQATAVYGDIDIQAPDGSLWPLAFSAFDYERLLEQGYCAHLFALRRDVAERLLDFAPTNLYRLLLALLDSDPAEAAAKVIHVPGPIATLPPFDLDAAALVLCEATTDHLRTRHIDAVVSPVSSQLFPAARVHRELPNGRTTIIIPTRNRLELLRQCLQSIAPAVMDADIIIVDNDSTDPDTCNFLSQIGDGNRLRIIRVEGPFNFARLNNIAVHEARTEFVCLLNNDVKALDNDWLSQMLTRINEADVGAVGALLIWPSGLVQHGGVVLGPSFAATHAFNDRLEDDPGYADLLRVAHECSAVTAACMLTRRSDYLNVGGMDEVRLPVSFNDVDFCLKLRQAEKRIVFTPHARLIHLESASRGKDRAPGPAARFAREIAVLRSRWHQFLLDDPYYSPMLSLDVVPFSGLAWPPRNMQARAQARVQSRDLPPGF